jgi:hypothetical protein
MSTERSSPTIRVGEAINRLSAPPTPEDVAHVSEVIEAAGDEFAIDEKKAIVIEATDAGQTCDRLEGRAATHQPHLEAAERQLAEAPAPHVFLGMFVLLLWLLDQAAQFVVINAGLPYVFDIEDPLSPLGVAITLTAVLMPMIAVKLAAPRIFGLDQAWDTKPAPSSNRARIAWLWCSIPFVAILVTGLYLPPSLAGLRALAIESASGQDDDAEQGVIAHKEQIEQTAIFMACALTMIGAVTWTYGTVQMRRAFYRRRCRRDVRSRRDAQDEYDMAADQARSRVVVARQAARDADVIVAARKRLFLAERRAELQAVCSRLVPTAITVQKILQRRRWPPAA